MGLLEELSELKMKSKAFEGCDCPHNPMTMNSASIWYILRFCLIHPIGHLLQTALNYILDLRGQTAGEAQILGQFQGSHFSISI